MENKIVRRIPTGTEISNEAQELMDLAHAYSDDNNAEELRDEIETIYMRCDNKLADAELVIARIDRFVRENKMGHLGQIGRHLILEILEGKY